jgi:hypothetical protein
MISRTNRAYPRLTLLALAAVIVSGVLQILDARNAMAAAPLTSKPAFAFNAVANATYQTATSCPNTTCPTCTSFFTLRGSLNSFTSFGPTMAKATVNVCISEDTDNRVTNGNQGTFASYCTPSSGIVTFNGTGKLIEMSFAGETCSLPNGLAMPYLYVVSGAFALMDTTLNVVSFASGGFNAFFNPSTNDASFRFTGTFSK